MLRRDRNNAFSLLEVVVIVALIAILAAIGIPRMSRGAKGTANAALAGDLRVLRGAIDHYAMDHGGAYPTLQNIAKQLTQYTNYDGSPRAGRNNTHIYGPYVRRIPPLPVGLRQGETGIDSKDGAEIGWIYDEKTGAIRANCGPSERDDALTAFRNY